MELSWDLTGYEELLKQAKKFENLLEISSAASVKETVLKLIGPLKLEFLSYLKGLYSKKRCAASHLMIFMIADECRNRKPYAVPVQFLSYKSITDLKLRELELEVERAMNSLGMIVIGKVCFNLILIFFCTICTCFSNSILYSFAIACEPEPCYVTLIATCSKFVWRF